MRELSLKVINRLTDKTVAKCIYSYDNFLANCGYRQFYVGVPTIYSTKSDKLKLIKFIYAHLFHHVLTHPLSYNTGVRKIVMSGSFSHYKDGRRHYSGYEWLNASGTGLFMLANDVNFVGEATEGKETGDHLIQMGEIVVPRASEIPDVKKTKYDKLYRIEFNNGGSW